MIKYYSAPLKKNVASKVAGIAKRLSFFAIALVLGGCLCFAINDGQLRFENYLYAQISQPISEIIYAVPKKPPKPILDLDATTALSLEVSAIGRQRVIFEKNTDEISPIASLTKLMTATIVVENPEIYNFEKQITISQNAADQVDVPLFGNLKKGDVYTVQQLLDLMLFYSSNDAAYSLAEIMGVDDFVVAMNQKAKDIGLENTEFYNSSGLDIDDGPTNYSTVNNLMELVKYILKIHPEIFSITTQPPIGQCITENGIFGLNFWDGQKLIGGKTGYTQKAGGCMIAIFEGNNYRYINILLGSASSESRVVQMQKMINYVNNSIK